MAEPQVPKLQPARQSFYRALGSAILDAAQVDALQSFAEWRDLVPMDPFAPFASP
jgi:hypothetical protein